MSIQTKIKTQEEIVEIVKCLKKKKKKIVTYNGSFDILHLGHIKSLEEARAQGDVLIVPLNSDKSVKSYKGPNHPVVPENERAETLAALECVDFVVIFDEINPKQILEKIKPDVHCNGSDWGKDCVEREVVEKNGGEIYILKWVSGLSTSKLIKKIIEVSAKPDVKAVFLGKNDAVKTENEPAFKKLSQSDYKIILAAHQSDTIEKAVKDFGINLSKSWIVGDDERDVILGREVNLKTIFIGQEFKTNLKLQPHYRAKDLEEAVKIIIQS